VTVWKVSPQKDYHALRLAAESPQVGEWVEIRGYPGGSFETLRARVKAHRGVELSLRLHSNMRPGYSGGPVLNGSGEVVGMAVGFTGPQHTPHQKYWEISCVSLETISAAIDEAEGIVPPPPEPPKAADELPRTVTQGRRKVIAFVAARGCSACEFFKRDLAAGHFRKFNIEVVTLNGGIWSDGGKAFEEFNEETKNTRSISMPVLWVPGTGQYKAGYQPERRGGIIGFLTGAAELLIGIVAGEEKGSAEMPKPYVRNRPDDDLPEVKVDLPPAPIGVPSELEEKLNALLADVDDIKNGNALEKISALRSLRSDVEGMKGQITSAETKATLAADGAARLERMGISGIADDVRALKEGNVIQKVKALASLKGDVKALRDGTKAEISDLKEQKSTNPLHALWGLVGIVTGMIHEIKGRR